MQAILDQKKADILTPEETIELEAIGELDEIFSYINAARKLTKISLQTGNRQYQSPQTWAKIL
ncbi:MAG: hypothetical protein KME17_17525 [Cyanosarcina radialis HA8281-LM2]|jgi:cob(I)alamin adenosyltransferase|nr:hypothetical protein [Cyanosarcina radialis HA8281-LM2]